MTKKSPSRKPKVKAKNLDISAARAAKIAEEEFDPALPLDNQQWEVFAQLLADGESATAAYQKAYECSAETANGNCARLMVINGIAARVLFLKLKAAEACGMTRDELLAILVQTLKTKPSEASMDNPLCELRMSKAGPFAGFMDKGRVAERLCKMLGWDAPTKVEHGGQINHIVLTEERRAELIAKKRKAIEANRETMVNMTTI